MTLCFHPRIPVSSLVDSWPSLLALLKDSVPLGLPAPGQFLILGLVSIPAFIATLLHFSVLSVTIIDLLLHTVRVRMNHPAANASVASYYRSHLTHSPLSSRVLNEFILKNPNLESKKDQRELQVISLWTRHPSKCFTLHQSHFWHCYRADFL